MGPIHIELNIFSQKLSPCITKSDEIRLPCSTLRRNTDHVGKIELNIFLAKYDLPVAVESTSKQS